MNFVAVGHRRSPPVVVGQIGDDDLETVIVRITATDGRP